MSKKLVALLICVIGVFSFSYAQDESKIVVKGTIVDAQTGKAVSFANLGVLGTVLGVASDMDGNFLLTVPYLCAAHTLKFSAIGYRSFEMKVYEGKDKPDLKIKLEPISYGMKEVNVYGELLVYKKMLRDVVDHISENYIDKPYNYEGYFKYITTRNGVEKMKEAVVTIYDAKGYNREDPETVFKDVCYKYNQVRRSEQPESVLDGLTALDDILTADIVRNTRNVLDIVNARDYKLKSKGKLLYEGDSVQVISYTAVKPSISTTGDPAVKTYSGEIYVNLKDFAVLKNVTHITSNDFNRLGRNLVTVGEAPKSDVKITITTTYKKLRDTYFLSGVNMDYSYHEEGEEVMGKMEFVTTKVQMETPVAVEGRTYYEDIKENQDFWNQYSAYFEE
jgi:hypothetical protein